jgi:hypothetical protein
MHVTGTISHCCARWAMNCKLFSLDLSYKRNLLGWAWSHFPAKHFTCSPGATHMEWFNLALDKIQSKKETRKFAHFVICFPELIFSY